MRVAFINEKGGTGKTTLAVHYAAWVAARTGERTLLVDLDPQGQVGKSLGFPPRPEEPTARALLSGEATPREAARATAIPELEVVPTDKRLAETAEELAGAPDADERLRKAFRNHRAHRWIVFDSPPSLGLLTRNVLSATSRVVIPVQLSYLALDGCAEIVQTIQGYKARGHHIEVAAIVPTFYRRTRMAQEVLERLRAYFPQWVTEPLGFAVAIDEAQSHGRTIWQYRPRSRAAAMLDAIARQIHERVGGG